MRHGARWWCAASALILVLGSGIEARADAGGAGVPEGSTLECGAIGFKGCCERDTAYYCDETGALQAIWCADNAVHSACGLEGPFVNCVASGASGAPRCSDMPQPSIGDYSSEPSGSAPDDCPTAPARLALDPDARSDCPGAPAAVDLYQSGCTFVMTPLTDGAEGVAIGQIEGRVLQLSFQRGETAVTCLARVSDDDGSVSGACDGPWGFDDTACTWSYDGEFSWPGPEARNTEAAPPGGDTVDSGSGDTLRDTGGGGSGCFVGSRAPASLALVLVAIVALALRTTARRRARRRDGVTDQGPAQE